MTSGHTSFNIRKFGPSPCAVKFHSVAQIVKHIHQSEFPEKKKIGEHQQNIIQTAVSTWKGRIASSQSTGIAIRSSQVHVPP